MKTSKTSTAKEKYQEVPTLENLHCQSKEWLSDIAFWNEEADFLKNLIHKNFVHLLAEEGIDTVGKILNELEQLVNTDLKSLKWLVEKHEVSLAKIIENPLLCGEDQFRREHSKLKEKFREFFGDYMAVKRRIFGAAEQVMRSERIKALKK